MNTHRERPCEDRGKVGVKCLQGREGQVLQATTRTYRRGLELTLPSASSEGISPVNITVSDSGLLNCERINFYGLKVSPLWYFMMVDLGNSYNFQQSSDNLTDIFDWWSLGLIFLIGEVWVHIVLFVPHTYRYWLHTWKTCLLNGHKVLIWVLTFCPFSFCL